jgi:hypothetical protein
MPFFNKTKLGAVIENLSYLFWQNIVFPVHFLDDVIEPDKSSNFQSISSIFCAVGKFEASWMMW